MILTTKILTVHNIWIALMLTLSVIVGTLAAVMGLAGTNTKILLFAWLFVPSPVILFMTLWKQFPSLLRIAFKTYIYLSMVITALLLMSVAWSGSETALHPEICEDMEELSDYPALEKKVEQVEFTAKDGTKLKGWLAFGGSEKAVVVLHGYRCDRRGVLREANMLFEAGMTVLLFDFRHSGQSEGEFVSFGYYEKQDVSAAVELLETLDYGTDKSRKVVINTIGLLGLSNGAATAILFASENPERVDALVVDSSFKSLDSAVSQSFTYFIGLPSFPFAPLTVWISELRTGLSRKDVMPEKSVTKLIDTPILIIHGLEDEIISFKDSEAIYIKANQPKEIWLVPDAAHGEAFDIAGDEYRDRVVNFFTNNLSEKINQ